MSEMGAFLLRRNGLTALGVLSLHAGVIWALQNSLAVPVPELIVPVSVLAQAPEATALAVAPPEPSKVLAPAPLQPKPATKPSSQPLRSKPSSTPLKPDAARADQPQANPVPPAANTPTSSTAATAATAPTTEASTPAATFAPAAPALQLPSTDAEYLRNPKPVYPALSKRLNEQGTAIHSVLIAADGQPVSAKLVKSSGFDRLDKAAYDAVMQWRYVPGKRQGVPEAMTFNVPIKWVLE